MGYKAFLVAVDREACALYKAALDIRDAAITSTDIGKRRDAVQKVRQLQDDAFAKLVDEKLAADESFRIFITLTNDIAQQLDAH